MRKRIVSGRFWMRVTPVLLLLAVVGMRYYQSRARGDIVGARYYQVNARVDANRWLDARAQEATHIEVSYGSDWHGSVWKHVATQNPSAMQRLLGSIRCTGSLTDTELAWTDDGVLGRNESFFITIQSSASPPERVSIYPSNDRRGIYIVTRQDYSHASEINIIGWAEMDRTQFDTFKRTLDATPGNRSAGTH